VSADARTQMMSPAGASAALQALLVTAPGELATSQEPTTAEITEIAVVSVIPDIQPAHYSTVVAPLVPNVYSLRIAVSLVPLMTLYVVTGAVKREPTVPVTRPVQRTTQVHSLLLCKPPGLSPPKPPS